ncbi:hypothetical protein AVEN_109615-1 [Araneus ventricosus]|uniref:Uncharacterized protein n=1 Tax=Araneus ventricosus TaxID=182803 RepID=A0A4Y2SR71_ARAVE|nr:hypothetical protein AVEN_236310-1 [Araneus ventricosus]GBN89450.1 hypothetical protein AVEN_109615-1 [Araneus ventricosus]
MAAPVYESRIFIPILPSLSHFAAVTVAVPLFKDFGMEMLDKVFTDIQHGKPTASNEGNKEDRGFNYNRAKENLLLIPRHLRKNVLEVVNVMHWAVEFWRREHSGILKFKDGKDFFHWRSDGTIDTIKIASTFLYDIIVCPLQD